MKTIIKAGCILVNKEQKEILEKLEESLKGQNSHSPKSSI